MMGGSLVLAFEGDNGKKFRVVIPAPQELSDQGKQRPSHPILVSNPRAMESFAVLDNKDDRMPKVLELLERERERMRMELKRLDLLISVAKGEKPKVKALAEGF